MKKSVIIIVSIIIVIFLGIVVAVNLKKNETKPAVSETVKNKTIENKIEENKIENNISESKNNNTENNTQEEEEHTEEEPKTDLDKAIDIVKKEWGEDNSVYFSYDEKTSDGEYIICVREYSTTNALMWYKVNIQDGTCEEW